MLPRLLAIDSAPIGLQKPRGGVRPSPSVSTVAGACAVGAGRHRSYISAAAARHMRLRLCGRRRRAARSALVADKRAKLRSLDTKNAYSVLSYQQNDALAAKLPSPPLCLCRAYGPRACGPACRWCRLGEWRWCRLRQRSCTVTQYRSRAACLPAEGAAQFAAATTPDAAQGGPRG